MLELTLADVIRELGLNYEIKAKSSNCICPVCSHKRKTLHLDFEKNLFRCNICDSDFQGGVLDFWAYHRGIVGSKAEVRKEAGKDISNYFRNKETPYKTIPQTNTTPKATSVEVEPANVKYISEVYNAFLEMLTLSNANRAELMEKRGLSPEAILRGGYKTFPINGLSMFCQSLLEKGYVLEGVPGFFKTKDNRWSLVRLPNGYLIPTKDFEGNTQGLQIRVDVPSEKYNNAKYITLSSSSFNYGTRGQALPHFNKGNGDFSKVILTEGPLKGNIISELTGYPVIAVLGVNTINALPNLLSKLKENGLEEILIAYDMDIYENPHVQKALKKLKGQLMSYKIPFKTLYWDRNFKGLDDYLLSKNKI